MHSEGQAAASIKRARDALKRNQKLAEHTPVLQPSEPSQKSGQKFIAEPKPDMEESTTQSAAEKGKRKLQVQESDASSVDMMSGLLGDTSPKKTKEKKGASAKAKAAKAKAKGKAEPKQRGPAVPKAKGAANKKSLSSDGFQQDCGSNYLK